MEKNNRRHDFQLWELYCHIIPFQNGNESIFSQESTVMFHFIINNNVAAISADDFHNYCDILSSYIIQVFISKHSQYHDYSP